MKRLPSEPRHQSRRIAFAFIMAPAALAVAVVGSSGRRLRGRGQSTWATAVALAGKAKSAAKGLSHPAMAVAAAALAATALTACGGSGSGGSGSTTTADGGTPVRGGTLTVLDSLTESLDPSVTGGVRGAVGYADAAIYDTLVYEVAGTEKIVPELATSITSKDGRVWTVKLRRGVQFTDGTPFDAAAVKFNWQRTAVTPSQSMPAALLIGSMTVVDPSTLQVTLKEANAAFPRLVARNLTFIGSPTAMKKLGDKFATAPVGAGPFVLKSEVPGSQRVFVRNPKYWDAPRPYVDRFVQKTILDNEQRYNTLQSGQGSVMSVLTAYNTVSRARAAGFNVTTVPSAGGFYLVPNLRAAPFDDVAARRALAAAIDRAGLIKTALDGGLPAFTSLYLPNSSLYDSSVKWPEYDPAEAQRLLDDYAAKHGGPLTVNFIFPQLFSRWAEYLQTQLSSFKNLKVNVQYLAFDVLARRQATGDFEATVGITDYLDPEPALRDVLSSTGALNWGHYANPAMDAALQTGRTALDQPTRARAYATVQALAIRDLPVIWLAGYGSQQLVVSSLKGVSYMGGGALLVDRAWFAKK